VAVRAPLRVARDHFQATFGYAPDGLWLSECGYYPGLEHEIAQAGYRYIVLDAHGLQQATSLHATGSTPLARPAAQLRSSVAIQIRRRSSGAPPPGTPVSLYRKYHRDLGYQDDTDLLADFLPSGVEAVPTGLKFHCVTGGSDTKALYEPAAALAQATRDARHFIASRRRQIEFLSFTARPLLIVAPWRSIGKRGSVSDERSATTPA